MLLRCFRCCDWLRCAALRPCRLHLPRACGKRGAWRTARTRVHAGKKAFEPGLLAKANRGILYVDEVSLARGNGMLLVGVAPRGRVWGAWGEERQGDALGMERDWQGRARAMLTACCTSLLSASPLHTVQVNLLDDHLVDVLLDSAASGWNTVEREGISISHPARFILVGSGNPEEGELRPQLLDRFGMHAQVRGRAGGRAGGRTGAPPGACPAGHLGVCGEARACDAHTHLLPLVRGPTRCADWHGQGAQAPCADCEPAQRV